MQPVRANLAAPANNYTHPTHQYPNTMKIVYTCIALAAALFSSTAAANAVPAPPLEHAVLKLMWGESRGAVLLVRADPQLGGKECSLNKHSFCRMHDEEHTLLFAHVQLSTTPGVKPGTLVMLELPTTMAQEPDSEFMLVALRDDVIRLTEDGSALFVPGYDWNMCRGSELLKHEDALQGIWKEMAELVKPKH